MKSSSLRENAAMAELRHGLRHFHLDDLAGRAERRLGVGDRREHRMLRQGAKHLVELAAERLGVDVADHGDHKLVAGEDAADIVAQVLVRRWRRSTLIVPLIGRP